MSISPCGNGAAAEGALERKQILDQIALLLARKAEAHATVVMVYDVVERREPPIVIEAALLMRE